MGLWWSVSVECLPALDILTPLNSNRYLCGWWSSALHIHEKITEHKKTLLYHVCYPDSLPAPAALVGSVSVVVSLHLSLPESQPGEVMPQ